MNDYPLDEDYSEKQEDKKHFSIDITKLIIWLGFALVFGSLIIPAYQFRLWLKDGFWTQFKSHILFSKILPNEYYFWLLKQNWTGLKKVLSYITHSMPLFLFVLLLGMVMLCIGFALPVKTAKLTKKQKV